MEGNVLWGVWGICCFPIPLVFMRSLSQILFTSCSSLSLSLGDGESSRHGLAKCIMLVAFPAHDRNFRKRMKGDFPSSGKWDRLHSNSCGELFGLETASWGQCYSSCSVIAACVLPSDFQALCIPSSKGKGKNLAMAGRHHVLMVTSSPELSWCPREGTNFRQGRVIVFVHY